MLYSIRSLASFSPISTERCWSGRTGLTANQLHPKRVSGVRIPPSPPDIQTTGLPTFGRLFGKWRIRDDIGKVWGCVPLDISNAEIPNDVVKGGLRLPASDVAKALFESVLKCQARKFG